MADSLTPPNAYKHLISKSRFVAGYQCLKKLYLRKFRKDLVPEDSVEQQQRYAQGSGVGELAQQCYPGGKDATPQFHYDYSESIRQTRQWLGDKEPVIYEAAFFHDEVLAALDILVREGGKLHAIEVKSSTEVKDYYLIDGALQYWVMKASGYEPDSFSIMHIDNTYVRQGEIDPHGLFILQDITEEVRAMQDEVESCLPEMKEMMRTGTEVERDIGPHCADPFDCEFIEHCWAHVPSPSIFDLYNLRGHKKWDLYEQGVVKLEELPDTYPLTFYQQLQVEAAIHGKPTIDAESIAGWMDTLQFPIHFLDFETINPAIPPFDGVRPYQQTPFQFSLHILQEPGAEPEHIEFLGNPGEDFRLPLVQKLLDAIGEDGDIIAFSIGFEKGCITRLAGWFPAYADQLLALHERFVDLITPFKKGWYYHPTMNGSNSIKSVLPALVPELSYAELEVGGGGDASAIFQMMVEGTFEGNEEATRQALLEYCKLDTWGMVRIWEVLGNLKD